jgi:hypothetical protein
MISFLAIFAIIVFLGGSAFGALVLFVISIHRTNRAPLSGIRGTRGAVSRSVLTTTRAGRREVGE